ncbi:MAG: carboxypeptidase regulatory-like domain-containing protein [Planctomycetota bacterium]
MSRAAQLRPVAPGLAADASRPAPRTAVVGSPARSAGDPEPPAGAAGLPVRLRLVDRLTLEPVPHCSVRLSQADRSDETCRSDADGWVEGRARFAAGAVELTLLGDDAPREAAPLAFQAFVAGEHLSSPDGSVAVDVGPTYRLDFESAPPVPAAQLALLLCGSDELTPGVPASLRESSRGPWVRFRGLQPADDPVSLCRLEARAPGGRWRASAEVRSLVGRQAEVVVLRPDGEALVRGRVEDENGTAVSAALFLTPLDAEPTARGTRWTKSNEDGLFRFEFLPPDDYVLELVDQRFEPWRAELQAVPGEESEQNIVLSPASYGTVSGTLRSRTGAYDRPLSVVLERADGSFVQMLPIEAWEESAAGLSADFEFEGVRAGDYQLRLYASSEYAWELPDPPFRAPISGLECVCLDDVSTRAVGIRARDARTGAKIEVLSAELVLSDGEAERLHRMRAYRSDTVLIELPPGAELDWIVVAPGYRPARGNAAAFSEEADDTSFATVTLEAGWGVELRILTGAGVAATPAAGARVLLDGRHAATAGDDGIARLEGAAAPERIEVKLGDHRIAGGDVDPLSGRLAPGLARGTVWLVEP